MAEAGRERKFEYIYNNTYKPDYEKEDSNVAKDGFDVLCEFFFIFKTVGRLKYFNKKKFYPVSSLFKQIMVKNLRLVINLL